jgi:hypothetical protein
MRRKLDSGSTLGIETLDSESTRLLYYTKVCSINLCFLYSITGAGLDLDVGSQIINALTLL